MKYFVLISLFLFLFLFLVCCKTQKTYTAEELERIKITDSIAKAAMDDLANEFRIDD